ncbi:MAG: class I SAM-dependent methyltransferase [Candidatus Hodarchaeales archaeon]|jgi:ubiquinone/menaquinone biosynthesis C-methylase UbiE
MVKRIPKRFFDFISPLYDFIIRDNPTSKIIEVLKLTGQERVLEIGAGTGRSVASVIPLARQVWILDPSQSMLQQAIQKFSSARPVLGYAEELPFDEGFFFDRVIAIDSLHHWDDQLEGLKEIKRVLEPKQGFSLIVEFDPSRPLGHYIKSMEKFFRMGSRFFTPLEMRKLHKQANLTIIRQAYVDEGTYLTISTNK